MKWKNTNRHTILLFVLDFRVKSRHVGNIFPFFFINLSSPQWISKSTSSNNRVTIHFWRIFNNCLREVLLSSCHFLPDKYSTAYFLFQIFKRMHHSTTIFSKCCSNRLSVHVFPNRILFLDNYIQHQLATTISECLCKKLHFTVEMHT